MVNSAQHLNIHAIGYKQPYCGRLRSTLPAAVLSSPIWPRILLLPTIRTAENKKTTAHPESDIPCVRQERQAGSRALPPTQHARSFLPRERERGWGYTGKCSGAQRGGGRRTRLDRPSALDTVALKRRPTDAQADDAQRPDTAAILIRRP